ncbi:streptogrisin C [Nocardiopsis mwathae]|uniref:Streptogrisin C n=1 Tax=Nocardiopsis mwathae TaxID=1472723 RepID=A0A7W9YG80_9ACTN|nr:S1 family peptidase [Nocardiopsis mwathae]MBB6171507.1 streptogrisin C [Nocardiopsis mwathae]
MTPIPHTLRLLGASLLALATLLALTPTATADTGRTATPTPTADDTVEIMAGDAVYGANTRCTIGATVMTADGTGGFLTTATCGRVGATVTLANGQRGTVVWSDRDGDGVAFVRGREDWILTPYARRYQGGGPLLIRGSQEADVGADVCRSGTTTGWHCGTIQAKNQTIPYPWRLRGMTRTDACGEPGDDGGPFYSGSQLQGILIAGSGNCRIGGITHFKPIAPVLQKHDLRLITG